MVRPSLDSALDMLSSAEFEQRVETVFVIGGGQVLPASPVERTAVCRTGCALMNAAPHCWRIWCALMNAAPNCRLKAVVPAVRRLGCNRPCRPRSLCVQVYKECMESPLLSAIHLTQVCPVAGTPGSG